MNVLIIGCGRIGAALALSTCKQGHTVTVVDRSTVAFERLGSDYPGRKVEGAALDQQVLQRAGIDQADGLAAVTSDDATNLVLARLGSQIFKIPNVVARVFDPVQLPAFEALGVQAVASASWGAQRLGQLLIHPGVITLGTLGHGEMMLLELKIPKSMSGTSLQDFELATGLKVSALVRGGNASIPEAGMLLEGGDLVVAVAAAARLKELSGLLKNGREAV